LAATFWHGLVTVLALGRRFGFGTVLAVGTILLLGLLARFWHGFGRELADFG
jgi:hypothetical protein